MTTEASTSAEAEDLSLDTIARAVGGVFSYERFLAGVQENEGAEMMMLQVRGTEAIRRGTEIVGLNPMISLHRFDAYRTPLEAYVGMFFWLKHGVYKWKLLKRRDPRNLMEDDLVEVASCDVSVET